MRDSNMASSYDPIANSLKNSFNKGAKSSVDSKMESNLQKTLMDPVQYDNPVRLVPSSMKKSYIRLNPKQETPASPSPGRDSNRVTAGGDATNNRPQLDEVPPARLTLFRRDQIQIGFSGGGVPGAGMFNMGNTCYLNSTLQALLHTPAFVNYLRHGGHEKECNLTGFSACTICLMSATLRQSQQSNVMKPMKIYEKLKMICKHLVHGRQEDAHEFLRYLIESLQKCYLVSRKVPKTLDNYSKETTPFNQIFGGYMRQELHCLKCRHVSITFQHFMDLLLDIRNADNIEAAMGGYFKKEILGQEEMYKCEKCKQKVPACKIYRIERPPLVLCIQLKRFNMMGGKNGRPVTLARNLDITNYVRWAGPAGMSLRYRLVSLINHVGPSPNCGHYTAVGEAPNGTFYRFDDASVNPASLQNVLNTSAYVIFYEITKSSRDQLFARNTTAKAPAVTGGGAVAGGGGGAGPGPVIGPQLPNRSPLPSTSRGVDVKASPAPSMNRPRLIEEPEKPANKKAPQIKSSLLPTTTTTTTTTNSSTSSSPASINKLGVVVAAKPASTTTAATAATTTAVKKSGGLVPYGDDGDSSSSEGESKLPPVSKEQQATVPPARSPFLPRAVAVQQLFKSKESGAAAALGAAGATVTAALGAAGGQAVAAASGQSVAAASNPSSEAVAEAFKSSLAAGKASQRQRSLSGSSESEAVVMSSAAAATTGGHRSRTSSESERAPSRCMERLGMTVSDKEAHNPSIHSDNSTGSTHSFTVSDIKSSTSKSTTTTSTTSSSSSSSTHNTWSVSTTTTPTTAAAASTGYSKRERSVPPLSSHRLGAGGDGGGREDGGGGCQSDTEVQCSPKKRQKLLANSKEELGGNRSKKAAASSMLDEMKLKTTEAFREIGKDVMSATAKIRQQLGIRSNKVTDKVQGFTTSTTTSSSSSSSSSSGTPRLATTAKFEDDGSSTSCEPSTSTKLSKLVEKEKDDSEAVADDESEEKEGGGQQSGEEVRKKKKHKKKKKNKNRSRHNCESEEEEWEEKTKETLVKSRTKSIASPSPASEPIKSQLPTSEPMMTQLVNSEPIRKSAADPTAPVKKWDSKPELKQIGRSVTWDGSRGNSLVDEIKKGLAVRSWSGERSAHLEETQEPRKRCASSDEEMDRGRTKKVKKYRQEERHYGTNPFQMAQDIKYRKESGSSNFQPLSRKSSYGDSYSRSSHHGSSSSSHYRNSYSSHDKYRSSYHSSNSSSSRNKQRERYRDRDHNYHRERPVSEDRRPVSEDRGGRRWDQRGGNNRH